MLREVEFMGRVSPALLGQRVAKRSLPIDKLLLWAYRDELPKRHISSAEGIWDRIALAGMLGITPEAPGPGGTAQRYAQFGLPHQDAEEIERAVAQLPDLILDWEQSRDAIMGDLAALLAARDVLLVKPLRTAAMVTIHAAKGTHPDWRESPPRPAAIQAEHGNRGPKIVGECRGKNLYTTGSYCPLRWSPSPISIAELRADYVCWHRGLMTLADTLELAEYNVLPPLAPALPWHEKPAEHRVFAVGERGPMRQLLLKPQRTHADAPPARPRSSAVRYPLDKG